MARVDTLAPSRPDPVVLSLANRQRLGFAAGVGAAIVMLVAMVVLRLIAEVPSLLEILADGILLLLPGALFSAVLDQLQHAAKPLFYVALAIGTLVVGGLLGRWYASNPTLGRALKIGVGTWLVFGLGIYSVLGAGPFGQFLAAGPLWHGLTLLGLFLIYTVALWRIYEALEDRAYAQLVGDASAVDWDRRALLQTLGGVLLGTALVGGLWRALNGTVTSQAPAPVPAAAGGEAVTFGNAAPWNVTGLSSEVTRADDFYTVSKNFIDPSVSAAGWKLQIDGMVDHPFELTYDQLQSMGTSENYYTLMCISNEVGGDLWGNALWKGVPLHTLLEQAGVQPGATKAVFTASDNYTDSVAIQNALNPDALLAWEMNGAPLEKAHGFPARLLIPGIYGMKNVKWIERITLVNTDFLGYWQHQGWNDAAPYQTASRIDTPSQRQSVAAGTTTVAGVAFAGDRRIDKVEVSPDNGQTWIEAQVKPGLSANSWQLWQAQVPVDRNVHTLTVRATDGLGNVQTQLQEPPFPNGSTGWDEKDVAVTSG
ncbi:MAG: molybdopterin-dependent oxidoreductase [Chloroflexi bacterium]|nr:molybdopterin-dependent oxidoreductase [Chloroflexota bacterium]